MFHNIPHLFSIIPTILISQDLLNLNFPMIERKPNQLKYSPNGNLNIKVFGDEVF